MSGIISFDTSFITNKINIIAAKLGTFVILILFIYVVQLNVETKSVKCKMFFYQSAHHSAPVKTAAETVFFLFFWGGVNLEEF